MSRRHHAGLFSRPEAESRGRSPELSAALPVHFPKKPLTINIISMSRRHHDGLFLRPEAESRGRSPELSAALPVHFPQKPLKTNYLSMFRSPHAGLFAEIEAESRGRSPEQSAVMRDHNPQKPLKIKFLYSGVTLGCPYCWHQRYAGCQVRRLGVLASQRLLAPLLFIRCHEWLIWSKVSY